MATPTIDISLLGYFTPVFMFLLIWAIVYAILHTSHFLGDNKVLHGSIALLIGLLVILSKQVQVMVSFMLPWFVVVFIIVVFILIIFKIFSPDLHFHELITHHGGLQWTILIVCIVIILGALSKAFGQESLAVTTPYAANATIVAYPGYPAPGYPQQTLPGGIVVSGPGQGLTATPSFGQNVQATFFHPKILGMFFILIITALGVYLLSAKITPGWPPTNGGGHGGH